MAKNPKMIEAILEIGENITLAHNMIIKAAFVAGIETEKGNTCWKDADEYLSWLNTGKFPGN